MDLSPTDTIPLDLGKLSSWAPELARTFVALSSDIALVIDASGVIRSVEQGHAEPIAAVANAWIGRSWIDTVSADTRSKIEKLLKEASSAGIARRREVNHPLDSGASVPVAYTAIRLGEHGPVLAVGRDMRAIAAIQERFIETQQDMERGYWSARQAESRSRLLFQVATDAVMVIDGETLVIIDANAAAAAMFSSASDQLVGKHAAVGFAHASRSAVNELLATARSSGESSEIRARLLGSVAMASVAATSFRADNSMRLVVRVRTAEDSSSRAGSESTIRSDECAGAAVVTDSSGRILLADAAFLGLLRLTGEHQATGRLLVDCLGAVDRTLDGLISEARRQGVVGRFAAMIRPVAGASERVEISASLLTEGDQERIGFTFRRQAMAVSAPAALAPELGIEFARLVERVGELPLTSLMSEAASLAEAHFIELAMAKSGGDADAAALLLGVGRDRLVRRVPAGARSFDGGTDTSNG